VKYKAYFFSMHLTAKECLDYYHGLYKYVKVMGHTGESIQIPAHHIRKFVTPNGINGSFTLYLDDSNKFIDLVKTD
jgi:hypothetical protein